MSNSKQVAFEISGLTEDPFKDVQQFNIKNNDQDIHFQQDTLYNKNQVKLFCRYWKPANGTPRAIVMLMHGYGEHLMWYHHVGVTLAKQGLLAFGHDHFGHGRSEGLRVAITDVNDLVDDAILHAQKMKQLFPQLPIFLVGHSMGGLVALLTVVREPNLFKGVVFNGPFIMLGRQVDSPVKKWCARTFSKFLPNAQVGKMDLSDVTGDANMIEKIKQDPLWWMGGVRLITGACFLNTVEKVHEKFPSVDVPFLIIHGEEDKLCDVKGSHQLMKQAVAKDKTIKTYKGAEHHLYLDKKEIREVAINDTVEWITNRV